jgi:hypothetical protein
MNGSPPRYRTAVGAVSLIVGPALMSIGDLFHPPESWDPAAQVAIVAESPSRWYAAHLLLFAGLLLFVPGILELTKVVAIRRPATGYAARVLFLISVGALSAVLAFEMLLGRSLSAGVDRETATRLAATFWERVFPALLPGLAAFFVGTALAVVTLASRPGPFRWPALALGLGASLILGEIILARVILSQIGNILCLVAGIAFARQLRGGEDASRERPGD